MKKMFLWLLLSLPLTIHGQISSDTTWPSILTIDQLKSEKIYGKFMKFIDNVEESEKRSNFANDMRIAILPVDKQSPFATGEAWSMKLDGENTYAICITKSILNKSSNLWLENIAQHEVCHIMLGHLEDGSLVDTYNQFLFEVEAMACTQEFLGEEKTIEFLAEYVFGDQSMSRKEALSLSRDYAQILMQMR